MKTKINICVCFFALFLSISCTQKENKIDIIEFTFFNSKKNSETSFLINLQKEYLLISNSAIDIKIPRSPDEISDSNEYTKTIKLENEIIELSNNNIKSFSDEIDNFTNEDFVSKTENTLDGGAFIINIIYKNKDFKNITRVNNFTENHTKLFYQILKIVSENSTSQNNKILINEELIKFSNE